MIDHTGNWATQQLAEFLAAVSGYRDEPAAIRGAVESAASAMEAEVTAYLQDGEVLASVGFPADRVPVERFRDAVAGAPTLTVEGIGECRCLVVPVGEAGAGYLVLARSGDDEFNREEANLLRAMGRCLALSLESVRLLEQERSLRLVSERQVAENTKLVHQLQERQRLLERLSRIQSSISGRAPLAEVLESIVNGAAELIGDEVVGLRLIDPQDDRSLVLEAHAGVSDASLRSVGRITVGTGAGGRAYEQDRLVIIEDYATHEDVVTPLAEEGLQAAMAAPVRENGRPVGSLVVGTHRTGRTYTAGEREVLLAFAEHASLALTDARTVEAMEHQAFHDALTGLPNRALFLDRLGQALKHRRQEIGAQAAVLFIDLDRFKLVNDSLGHAAGDTLLIEVARRLSRSIRKVDTAARLGGDEFAVVIEETSGTEEALHTAARIRKALNLPVTLGTKEMSISATVGVALADSQEPAELLRNADLAMYHAKVEGDQGYALYRHSMHAALVERLELEESLRRAMELEQFEVYYQPVVELESGTVSGVEALVRWNRPGHGVVGPVEFIPMAEETGLIVPLGRWVLGTAMRQAAGWTRHGGSPLSLSVNISARQLQRPELVDEVRDALVASGFDPGRLTLEITETILMQDRESSIERLHALKALGVRIAIDDFGTGYSSLGYLRHFPVDVLKIDRAFVKDLGNSAQETAVAAAIMALSDTLSLDAVAEGIEEAQQLDELRKLGCHLGQGYLFAKPLAATDLEALLSRPRRPHLLIAS